MSHGGNQQAQQKRPQRGGPGRGGPMGGMMRGGGAKAKNFKAAMGQLLKYLGRYKVIIVVSILIAIASTTASIVGPKILGRATTELF